MTATLSHWEQIGERGATQFSNWNDDLFQQYCEALTPPLQASKGVLANLVAELIREAVGCGYLTVSLAAEPRNLMEHCFRKWLVAHLKLQPAKKQSAVLVNTWNLLEGLLSEPAWVNAYVMARVRELTAETELEAFLVRILTPLFEPSGIADWAGPYRVTTLSLRPCHDDFLPGEMHLVAPSVLAIKDRRNDMSCGVILRKQGRSELAGTFGATLPYSEPAPTMTPQWNGTQLLMGKEQIPMAFFPEPLHWVQTRAGFVVANAINSQKIWIVESAT